MNDGRTTSGHHEEEGELALNLELACTSRIVRDCHGNYRGM
ncbi:hypothetical protein PROFUN_04425 [Planoprotostelium fungivorum]|uniref:Uncharacterized protein n=1 Tax=Planoprotostelium fungivorum TaxID=1890364 RepID=A0A2P6NVK0_9EUKA|nr:hypothetical protein PROFUN_04425 [Planoprotostelium fungivorum]